MRHLVTIVVAALCLAACGGADGAAQSPSAPPEPLVEFRTDEGRATLRVEVAATAVERARGLQGVTDLPPDRGMAFVFDGPVDSTFWMKDTPIPLSIAFVDDAGEVITIRDMEPCRQDPCPLYSAAAPFVLAVEAHRGWFDAAGVDVGDRAQLRAESIDG